MSSRTWTPRAVASSAGNFAGDVWRAVDQDDETNAVVLRGAGAHFCAGADIGWMRASAELDYDANVADATAQIGRAHV